MREIFHIETALLGLISEKPMYPYEIEKSIWEYEMQYLTDILLSSIYKVLESLRKDSSLT
jgi:DNA-binding PadR family transcriptional regulator